jgi:hypothetical protein
MKRDSDNQPKVRSHVAVAAHFQTGGGTHGKRGKGRTKRDDRSRSTVKSNLRSEQR